MFHITFSPAGLLFTSITLVICFRLIGYLITQCKACVALWKELNCETTDTIHEEYDKNHIKRRLCLRIFLCVIGVLLLPVSWFCYILFHLSFTL